jgi:murein L,D-transpeptidase YcbB/YkuD
MHGRTFDRILTGTAIALVLGLGAATPAAAQANSQAAIEARVPLPDTSIPAPPTAADVAPASDTTGSTSANLPDPPAIPPAATAAPTAPAPAAAPVVATPAPAAAPAPAPAPVVAANPDQPIMDALRDYIGSNRISRVVERKTDRTAVEAFYASRDYAPIWVSSNGPTAIAKQAGDYLRNSDADGMDPTEYPVPAITAGASPTELAEAEIRLTESVIDYARHASTGRVHYSRVAADITYDLVAPQSLDVLSKVSTAKSVAEALDSYQPPHPAYKALRKKLAEVRGKAEAPEAQIARGPVLDLTTDKKTKQTILMSDERVPALRAKLGLDPVNGDTFYDKPLADAVARYQKEKGLPSNGKLTQATVDAMNGKRQEKSDQIIIANMERWRWVPRDLGKAHVVLNVPDFTLQVYNEGQSIWKTRVVVGKPGNHATPLLSETMKYITVNPTWNVPPSIVYNEYLPALQQDPTVLKRMGLNLVQRPDGSVHISQPPGEANALGRVRFNFPNKFLVYQHDTPDKHLFAHPRRAYSHGCMRVQDPAMYAQVITGLTLPGGRSYTADQIKGMYGKSEVDLRFQTPIWVHITYQSAFVDENGTLQIREDIYGRDARTLAALKSGKNSEVPVAHAQPNYSRPSVRLPNGVGGTTSGWGSAESGPSFFDRLFGNPVQPQQPAAQQKQRRTGSAANSANRTATR